MVRCMFEVRPTCRPMVDWTLNVLDSSMDKIFLAKPRAIDHSEQETPTAQRMLSTFAEMVVARDFGAVKRPLKGDAGEALRQVMWKPVTRK